MPTSDPRSSVAIEYHQKHFKQDALDDDWLGVVGGYEWVVLGHDSKFHERPSELTIIKQYEVGCFYLCGANDSKWETLRVFLKAYDKIVKAAEVTGKPFIFRVDRYGRLRRLRIP